MGQRGSLGGVRIHKIGKVDDPMSSPALPQFVSRSPGRDATVDPTAQQSG